MSTSFDPSYRTLRGRAAAQHRIGGRNGSFTTRRQTIENYFGEASFRGSSDDKVNFEWVIEIENEVVVRIWDYKTNASLDEFNTIQWSVDSTKLGAALLFLITGIEVGR